jgi:hypothetical protein
VRKQWLTAGVVVTVIGCGVSSNEGPAPSASGSSLRAAAMRETIKANGRAIGGSTYLVRGGRDIPDFRAQLQTLMREHPAASSGADWNVATGAPVHTAPATYSSFSASSPTDQVAVAVDATNANATDVGYASGALNNTAAAGTSAVTSTLIVLSQLYGSQPTVLYYNNQNVDFAPFGYLDYSFPTTSTAPRIYGLDTSGNAYCYASPLASSSSTTTPTQLTACNNWGGSAKDEGKAVTYSAPYPVYGNATVSGIAAPGDVVRIYFTDNNDNLNCLSLEEETTNVAPKTCKSIVSASNKDFTGGAGTKAGPPVVNEITGWSGPTKTATGLYTIYFGDQAGVFYEVEDNNGVFTQTNAWCLASNAVYTGSNCTTTTQGANSVVGSPTIFNASSGSSYVFVASGTRLFQFPIPTTTTIPTSSWSSSNVFTATLNSNQSAPIFGGPSFDYTNNVAYVATSGQLYTAGFNPTISGFATATTLAKYPAGVNFWISGTLNLVGGDTGSFPLGGPFTFGDNSGHNWVFANGGYGGSTSLTNTVEANAPIAVATGGVEQYAGATGTSALTFMQATASAAGTIASSSDTVDWQLGNVYFGYDNGWTSNGNPRKGGTGGIVQAALGNGAGSSPTSGWTCPTPYTAASGACDYNNTYCRTSDDCSGGEICANEGTAPAYTCVVAPYCRTNTQCTTSGTSCDVTAGSGDFGTCVVGCTKDSQCLADDQICDLIPTDANFHTCQNCDATEDGKNCTNAGKYGCNVNACVQCSVSSTCATNTPNTPACNTTTNTCVVCASNSDCTSTNKGNPSDYAVCDTTTNTCVQCMTNSDCTGNPNGTACNTSTNLCVACSPADGNTGEAPGNGCTDTNYPICEDYSGTTPSCGQCTTANTSACPSGGCASNGHCVCIGGLNDCPGTQTCSTSVTDQVGSCND